MGGWSNVLKFHLLSASGSILASSLNIIGNWNVLRLISYIFNCDFSTLVCNLSQSMAVCLQGSSFFLDKILSQEEMVIF